MGAGGRSFEEKIDDADAVIKPSQQHYGSVNPVMGGMGDLRDNVLGQKRDLGDFVLGNVVPGMTQIRSNRSGRLDIDCESMCT